MTKPVTQQLDLGNGHILEFVNAPNLHWPDTIFTYDHGSGIGSTSTGG